ncbi:MAG: hypothetical protein JO131_02145 [Gammaproteobacteria bacterium]|nr:hypothetical protein [Gammaproteobacteria bacterium]
MKNTRKTGWEDDSSPESWDNRRLGASEEFVRKSSPEREKTIDDNLGLQTISIRLQKALINDLKTLADSDGIGYQPYIRQVLTRHVRREKGNHRKHIQEVK